ncbi:hypothetical protein [Pseudomonas helvetica]
MCSSWRSLRSAAQQTQTLQATVNLKDRDIRIYDCCAAERRLRQLLRIV